MRKKSYCPYSHRIWLHRRLQTQLHSLVVSIHCHFELFLHQSTCILASNQRINNRTKYLLSKWHWFWDRHNEAKFSIIKCPSHLMMADYLTKPLVKSLFEDYQKLMTLRVERQHQWGNLEACKSSANMTQGSKQDCLLSNLARP